MVQKPNKIITIAPDDIAPRTLDVNNYFDGEWLYIEVEGEAQQTYLTLSDTERGSVEGRNEGFADVNGEMDGTTSRFFVPPETIDSVSEGGTIYLNLWTSPDPLYRDKLRAKGSMIRKLAARRDRRKTPNVPELVIAALPDVSVEVRPGEHLEVEIVVSGGLPPLVITSTIGAITDQTLRIALDTAREEIVAVTVIDSRGVNKAAHFALSIFTPGIGDAVIGSTFEVA